MKKRAALILLMISFATGCSSTFKYNPGSDDYRKKPLVISTVKVDITLTSAKQPDGYLTEKEMEIALQNQITQLLTQHKTIRYDQNSPDGLQAVINLNYLRKFSYGNAIAKPEFSGAVHIDHESSRLATHIIPKSTTQFGGFRNALVNAEVATGKWDHEDEPRDLEAIAISITKVLKDF